MMAYASRGLPASVAWPLMNEMDASPSAGSDAQLKQLLEQTGSILRAESATLASQKIGAQSPESYLVWRASNNNWPRNLESFSLQKERRAIYNPAPSTGFCGPEFDLAVWNAEDGFETHAIHMRLGVWAARQWIVTVRREVDHPFSHHEVSLASQLRGILRHSFNLWRQLQETSVRLSHLETLSNTHNCGVIVLDRNGRLIFANNAANAILDREDALMRSQESIVTAQYGDAVRLQACIQQALRKNVDKSAAIDSTLVAITRPNARPLSVAVLRIEAASHTDAPAAALFITDPDRNLTNELAPICMIYGLTPTETRLACQLAIGQSVQEAAVTLGIREQTARAYLRQIFLKLDIGRQVDLIRLLFSSIINFNSKVHLRT